MKKKAFEQNIIIIFVLVAAVLGAAYFLNLGSILNAGSYYKSIDAELSKSYLQAGEDNVNIDIDWVTTDIGRDHYKAYLVFWIYKNGQFYSATPVRRESGTGQVSLPISGFKDGVNDITVKIGLQDYFKVDYCTGTYSKTCGGYTYKGSSFCTDQVEMFSKIGCSVWDDVPQDMQNYDPSAALSVQRDTSSEIGSLTLVTKNLQIYRVQGIESQPPACTSFLCRVIAWIKSIFGR